LFREDRQGAPGRPLRLCRRRRLLPLRSPKPSRRWSPASSRWMGEDDRRAPGPTWVVVACNTASTAGAARGCGRASRFRSSGRLPAIKPACSISNSKLVTVLGTEATVKRGVHARAHPPSMANNCGGHPGWLAAARGARGGRAPRAKTVSDPDVGRPKILPCFVENRRKNEPTRWWLACTHYPLLLPRFERLALWPVNFIDPAPAIARRVVRSALARRISGAKPLQARTVFTLRPRSDPGPGRGPGRPGLRGSRVHGRLTPPPNSPLNYPPILAGRLARACFRPAILPVFAMICALAAKPVGSGKPGTKERARSSNLNSI